MPAVPAPPGTTVSGPMGRFANRWPHPRAIGAVVLPILTFATEKGTDREAIQTVHPFWLARVRFGRLHLATAPACDRKGDAYPAASATPSERATARLEVRARGLLNDPKACRLRDLGSRRSQNHGPISQGHRRGPASRS